MFRITVTIMLAMSDLEPSRWVIEIGSSKQSSYLVLITIQCQTIVRWMLPHGGESQVNPASAIIQKQLYNAPMSFIGGSLQSIAITAALCIDISASLQQQLHHLLVPPS